MKNSKTHSPTSIALLGSLSWGLVAYTIVIVVWGAWVRISGSGDGCGDHWPLCNGQVVPIKAHTKTWIEFLHRASTAIYGVLVVLQAALAHRLFSAPHPARLWSLLTALFTVSEALIGRQLVTMGLVNESESLARVVVMPLHLVNTALLLVSTVMTAEAVKHGEIPRTALPQRTRRLLGLLTTVLLVILTTGAIAALGSHLAPSGSLLSGFSKDISSESHLAVRLRILHPALALIGALAIWTVLNTLREEAQSARTGQLLDQLTLTLGAAVLIGICTLLTLTPNWLKMVHLLMANVLIVMASRCAFHILRPSPLDDSQRAPTVRS